MEIKIDRKDVYPYTDNHGNDKIIYGSLNGNFEVGDRVEVISIGQVYSSYTEMILAMGLPKDKWNKYSLKNGYIGTVLARKVHCSSSDILYGVQFNCIHIIGQEGLRLVEKKGYIQKFGDKDYEWNKF